MVVPLRQQETNVVLLQVEHLDPSQLLHCVALLAPFRSLSYHLLFQVENYVFFGGSDDCKASVGVNAFDVVVDVFFQSAEWAELEDFLAYKGRISLFRFFLEEFVELNLLIG